MDLEDTLTTVDEIKKEPELSITQPDLNITKELENEPEISEEIIELESSTINSSPKEETETTTGGFWDWS